MLVELLNLKPTDFVDDGDGVEKIIDYGATTAIGPATHGLTLHCHVSRAFEAPCNGRGTVGRQPRGDSVHGEAVDRYGGSDRNAAGRPDRTEPVDVSVDGAPRGTPLSGRSDLDLQLVA
jgi:hypothetical protein